MKHYPHNIIHNGKKIKGGTRAAASMEEALEKIKLDFGIVRKSNGLIESNYMDGKSVSIAIFG